jgi:hypothetical protein
VATGIATAGPRGDGIINHPNDVGGYPAIPFVEREPDFDTDGDGMPNEWEDKFGLDTGDPADRNDDFDADGFTNLEEYLNELGAFKAVQDVVWDNELASGRYAQIENWDLAFQPSRFDTAVIDNATVVVDAVGQDAGTLKVGQNATGGYTELHVADGWLRAADTVEVGSESAVSVRLRLSGGALYTPLLEKTDTAKFTFTGGELHADEVAFDLANDGGTIAPGSSTGQTHVAGSLTINSGAIEIELASAEDYDRVTVDAAATVAGELEVVLLEDFEPAAGTAFEILSADGGVTGRFETLAAPELAGLMWRLEYAAASVELVALVAGDYNADGIVDAADFTVWRDMLGQSGAGLAADGDGDGMIELDDYAAWKANFGRTAEAGGAALSDAVPEPASILMMLSGALLFGLRRHHAARNLSARD